MATDEPFWVGADVCEIANYFDLNLASLYGFGDQREQDKVLMLLDIHFQ